MHNLNRTLSCFLAVGALAACSTAGVMPTATSAAIMEPTMLAAAGSEVVSVDQAPAGSTSLGTVDIYACQAHNFDPVPTDDLAIAMLKAEAARRGARYLASVQLTRQNIDIERNCYWTIHASGAAYS